jgi:hypothetical protein
MSTRTQVISMALLWLLGAAPAWGKDADPCGEGKKDPRQMAETGLRLYKEAARLEDPAAQVKEYERALRCYQAAILASSGQAAKVYHPLGLVYEKLERYVEAVEAFKRFLAEVPENQRNPGVTKQITDKLKALRPHVAELLVDTVPGLEVRVDDRVVGRAPLPGLVVVSPGAHVVQVGDPGVGTLGAEVKAVGGQRHRVDLTAWRPREAPRPKETAEGPQAGQPAEKAAEYALLMPRSNRKGAQVEVDGKRVGVTPLSEVQVLPGPHTIVGRDGGQQVTRSVTLLPRERLTVELRFPVKPWVWALTGVAAAAVAGTAVGVGVYYGTSVGKPDGLVGDWR